MINSVRQWLQQQADAIGPDTLSRVHSSLVTAQNMADFLTVLSNNTNQPRDLVRADVQLWAITTVGYDAPAAAEWLRVIDALKESIVQALQRDMPAGEALAAWRLLDPVFTSAYIELTYLSSDLDRTEMVDHQVQLRRQMKRLEQTKTQFVTVAAHELRTPLTIIEGYARMMGTIDTDDKRLQIFIDGLGNGIRRMHEIIEDIIDVSMIDLDAYEINYQEMRLNKMVEQVASNLERHFQERFVDLVVIPFPDEDKIFADEEKLIQALTKLLENALKFTPEGGRVTMSLQRVRTNETSDAIDGFVDLCITDTGIGIDSGDLERIFDKFTSVLDVSRHSSSKTNYLGGGPGLGLPIAKGIVDAHGGRIWVESLGTQEKVYPGSTFHVELPLRRRRPEPG